MTTETIRALLDRVRAGDEGAAARLVREHGEAIRRLARLYLTDPRPGRGDAPDVWQWVLTMFLERAAAGRLDLGRPEQLRLLLNALSHNEARAGTRPPAAEREVCHE